MCKAPCVRAKSLQPCPTLCDLRVSSPHGSPPPCDSSPPGVPPGSSIHGILQARILEWVAMTSSSIFPTQRLNPRLWCPRHCSSILHHWASREDYGWASAASEDPAELQFGAVPWFLSLCSPALNDLKYKWLMDYKNRSAFKECKEKNKTLEARHWEIKLIESWAWWRERQTIFVCEEQWYTRLCQT